MPFSAAVVQRRGNTTYPLSNEDENTIVSSRRGSATYPLLSKGENAVVSSGDAVERQCDLLAVARG